MPTYRAEVFYRTKRENIVVGMDVEAFDPEEAEQIARDKVLKGYPARKLAGCKISANGRSMISLPTGASIP